MDQYCVVVCGLQAGAPDDASVWLPVAAALKLDLDEFARRVLAALPRIVRQGLDQATAERIAQLLQGMHVDARALPDDGQLAYIDCPDTSCGPLPLASLGDFIQPGEMYRLHGSTAWLAWPAALDRAPTGSSPPVVDFDDAAPASHDEPFDATPDELPADAIDDAIDATPEELPGGSDEEAQDTLRTPPPAETPDDVGEMPPGMPPATTDNAPRHAMPPPLPAPPSVETPATAVPADHAEADTAAVEADDPVRDDELINPPEDDLAPADPDTATSVAPEGSDVAAAARPRSGRLIALLVLVGLAGWAYYHWMGDARTGASPATATSSRSSAAGARSAAPARTASVQGPAPATAPAASVAASASTLAPATAASVPAPAATTAAPAAAASAPAPAATAAAPTPAASAGDPATNAGSPVSASTVPAPTASTPAPATTTR